jgi:regulator of cell morphogenesis and NO signaling
MLFTKRHKLADIILHDYNLIPVFSRFGIQFGFADKTVDGVCKEKNINSEFFLVIINSFHQFDSFPQKKIDHISAHEIVSYLKKSHEFFNTVNIPKIQQLIEQLSWNENDTQNRKLLSQFFFNYRDEVFRHTMNEENSVYPIVEKLEIALKNSRSKIEHPILIIDNLSEQYEQNHDDLDEKLLDLKNIIIKYLPPSINSETENELLAEIFKLEKELIDHTRIENRILIPVLKSLEKKMKKRIEKESHKQ